MKMILLVYLGNICRSPMAEGLMNKKIKDLGLNKKILVESRATSSYEIGRSPHEKTQRILRREKAELSQKKAQRISQSDFETFDYIMGMDKENVADLKRLTKTYNYKIHLFRDINPLTKGEDVPDPYYSGNFDETFLLVNEYLDLWLDHIKKRRIMVDF